MKRITALAALLWLALRCFAAPEDEAQLMLIRLNAGDLPTSSSVKVAEVLTVAEHLGVIFGTQAAVAETAAAVGKAENAFITRAESARLLRASLPDNMLSPINEIVGVGGLAAGDPAYEAVRDLFAAGLFAVDPVLDFRPQKVLTHVEWDGMLEKLVFPERRVHIESAVVPERQAYLLCVTNNLDNQRTGIESGWEYDNRAGFPKQSLTGNSMLTDAMTDEGSRLVRYFNEITGDTIEMYLDFFLCDGVDGVSFAFCGEDDSPVYRLVTANGRFNVENADGSLTPLCEGAQEQYSLHVTIDLHTGYSRTVINNVDYGVHPLRGDTVRYFAVSTGTETTGAVMVSDCFMIANYAVYEDFDRNNARRPYDMRSSGSVSFNGSMTLGASAKASRSFDPIAHTASFNFNTFLASGHSGMKYALMSGENEIVCVTTQNGKFYANGVDLGKTFSANLWWKLRVEADFERQKADIKVNAKVLATVDFLTNAFFADGIRFENLGASGVSVDDVKVYNIVDSDVPAPVKPDGEEDYVIGVNVCSLWINGDHDGWACVTPFDDFRPVLGYYDEGLTETADWENKFMAEHGVDFQAFCWYAGLNNSPLKSAGVHLEEAYLHSQYKSDVKFAILWEAANSAIPWTEQAFYDYYVPYWIENYFSDPDYVVLDNGANGLLLLGVFGPERLIAQYGSPDAGGEIPLKRMFDYLDSRVREELGYDGVIISACNAQSDELAKYGFDAWNAYGWGTEAYSVEINKNRNLSARRYKDVYTIPTVCVGYNHIPWVTDDRHPLMTPSDYTLIHEWVRDTYLPTYAQNDGKTWNDNLVWLSNWNEYGEGTYLMPCEGLNGFGYLDALRAVYSNGGAHADTVPTDEQKARLTHNYPQDRRLLRAYGGYTEPTVPQTAPKTSFDLTSSGEYYADWFGVSSCTYISRSQSGTVFRSSPSNPDVIFVLKPAMWSGLAADDIKAVHVVMSGVPAGQKVQLFYQTDRAPLLSEENSVTLYAESAAETDYVFDFADNAKWRGKLNALRLDPLQITDTSFTVRSISFELSDTYKCVTAFTGLTVNGVPLNAHIRGFTDENGVAYYPFEPGRNLLNFYLYCHYDWDYDTGTLTLCRDGRTFTFTVGSDVCLIDGAPMTLEGTVSVADNIPLLPVRGLCRALGFRCVKDGNDFRIETPERYLFDNTVSRSVAGNWTFDTVGSIIGWGYTTMTVYAGPDYLRLISNYGDPLMRSDDQLGLSCEDYPTIEIRLRGKCVNRADMDVGIYFTTQSETSETQTKYVGALVQPTLDEGTWQTVRLDMSANSHWTGTLKQLRFDPFNDAGIVDVAYIRLLDANGTPVPLLARDDLLFEKTDFETLDASPFGGNVSVVADEDAPANHSLLACATGGRQWVHASRNVVYTPGATYRVEFDVKIEGEGTAAEGQTLDPDEKLHVNCDFQYADGDTVDHNAFGALLSMKDGWVHVTGTHTVSADSTDRSHDGFGFFSHPPRDYGVNYRVDNIVVTRVA